MTKKKTPPKKLTVKKETVERLTVEKEAADLHAGRARLATTQDTNCVQCNSTNVCTHSDIC